MDEQRLEQAAPPHLFTSASTGFSTAQEREAIANIALDRLTLYAIVVISHDGRIARWNAGAQQLFGYEAADVVGRDVRTILATDDERRHGQTCMGDGATGDESVLERWHVRRDQTRFWANETTHVVRDTENRIQGFVKLIRDHTSKYLIERGLCVREQLLSRVFESVDEVAIFALDGIGRITSWNAGAISIFGHPARDVIGCHYRKVIVADVDARPPESDLLAAQNTGLAIIERVLQRRNGDEFYARGSVRQLDPGGAGSEAATLPRFVCVLRDATLEQQTIEALRAQAEDDDLTMLQNRRAFYQQVRHAIALTREKPEFRFALLFIDLDGFKAINDRYGHPVGDTVLCVSARRIQKAVRAGDVVARLGGDEFAVLMTTEANEQEVVEVAGRIDRALRAPIRIEQNRVTITASIGIALSHPSHRHPEDVVRDADRAMYQAKADRRAQSIMYDSEPPTTTGSR